MRNIIQNYLKKIVILHRTNIGVREKDLPVNCFIYKIINDL